MASITYYLHTVKSVFRS